MNKRLPAKRYVAILLIAAFSLQLIACGSEGKEEAPASEEAVSTDKNPALEEEENALSMYVGAWKYDAYDLVLAIDGQSQWACADGKGDILYSGKVVLKENGFLLEYDDSDSTDTFQLTDDGKLIDADGNTLSKLDTDNTQPPTADDQLTQVAYFPGKFEAFSINYPEKMTAKPRTDLANSLDFNVVGCIGMDDSYATTLVTFQPLQDIDQYMGKGAALAKPCMGFLLNNCVNTYFGSHLINMIGTDFEDHGSYYSIKGYMWFSGEIYDKDFDKPVRGITEMRYFGPTGYGMIATTIAPESVIERYAAITAKMLDTCTYKTDWSTAPKVVPAQPQKQKRSTKKSTASDSGDYGTAYYWTDEDGDIWYWNGYENIFQSFGTDGYIDDDGEYYESNDAGWDVDNYYDDYDIYSDPGDGFDAWSDPGDYAYSDIGDNEDYNYEYSDSGDYGDYGDYGDDW